MQPEIAIPLVLHCGKGSRKIWRQSIRFGLTIVVFACSPPFLPPQRRTQVSPGSGEVQSV
jgi:hypothetical protein